MLEQLHKRCVRKVLPYLFCPLLIENWNFVNPCAELSIPLAECLFNSRFPITHLYNLIKSSRNLRNFRGTSPKSLRRLRYGRCLIECTEWVANLWTDSFELEAIAEEGFQTRWRTIYRYRYNERAAIRRSCFQPNMIQQPLHVEIRHSAPHENPISKLIQGK